MARERRGPGLAVDPERVRLARLEAGLSLSAVAGDEISRTFVHQIERGVSRPSLDVLKLIARRTGKPLDYFVPGSGSRHITHAELSSELTRALDLVTRIAATKHQRAEVRRTVRSVAVALRRAIALARALEVSAQP